MNQQKAFPWYVFWLLAAFALPSLAQTQPNFIPRVNGGGTNTTLTNAIAHDNLIFKGGNNTNLAIRSGLSAGSVISSRGVDVMTVGPSLIAIGTNLFTVRLFVLSTNAGGLKTDS